MVEEYNKPEYKPYPSTSPPKSEGVGDKYDYSVDELINRLSFALNTVKEHIQVTREGAATKALMNTERDELMNLSVSSVWDGGTELPLLVYEVVGKSQNARHQYIADVALEASRGVSGDYCLDRLDLFKMLETEISAMLEYLKTIDDDTPTIIPMYAAVWQIEQIVNKIPESLIYNRIHLNYYAPNREEPNAEVRAAQIQKSIHGQVAILNSSLTSNKKDVIEISKTADTFYKEKIASLSTPYTPDVNKATTLITNRTALLEYAAMDMLKIFSAGNSLKQTWQEQSVTSGISIPRVAQQAYISNNPQNLASGTKALVDFAAEITEPLQDASMLFVRKQGYTKEDAIALVEMLNSLPETHTYISAGIINVRAQPEFVHALIDQINNMPPNSTLISGGMIALIGGKTLSEFQDEVESGQYSGGIADVQQVIDVLNGTLGEGYDGLTILLPGIIGLTGNEGIREAIVDAINNFGVGTLIGPGAILVSGGDSLADKAGIWDDAAADASQAAADALQAMQDAANAITLVDHEIVGFFQDAAPTVGMEFADIWIDTDDSPVDTSSIYRYEDVDGGSTGALAWRAAPNNGIGLVYLEAYGAQATADGKITSYFQDDSPGAPAVGDLWIDTNDDNKLYRWDGAEWDLARDAGITTALEDAADALEDAAAAIEILDGQIVGWYQASAPAIGGSPVGAKYGDIWIDIDDSPVDTSSIYRCEDVTGGHSGILAWYAASTNAIGLAYLAAYDAQSTADGKIVTFYQSEPPTAVATGDLWVDTNDNNILYRWDGAQWVSIRDYGISQALEDAADALEDAAAALEIADGEIVGWYQSTAPAIGGSPVQAVFGDIWIDTDDVALDSSSVYRCEDITGGSQGTLDWRAAPTNAIGLAFLSAYNAQTTADGKIKTYYQASIPTASDVGDLWIDTDDSNKMYRSASVGANEIKAGEWEDARDEGISQALQDAAGALEIADGEIVGWFTATEPVIGGSPAQAHFGDIWVDIDDIPVDSSSIYRCEDSGGGSQGVLGWYSASTNAIGLAYLAAYTAQTTADGKIVTFYQSSIPTSTDIGDLWIDTDDDNKMYRAASVGANEIKSGEWVLARDGGISQALQDAAQAIEDAATAQGTADGKVTTFFQDNAPTAEGEGDLWIDTNDGNKLYRWDTLTSPASWIEVQDDAIGIAIQAASDAQSTADGKIITLFLPGPHTDSPLYPIPEGIGDLWIDTADSNRLYRWSGTDWIDARDAGISQALEDAAAALEIADGEIVGWFQASAPVSGMTFGDIWIDTDDTPVDSSSIYRYQDPAGGSQGVLAWYASPTNAIGLVYLNAYNAQSSADGKVVTFYQSAIPTSTGIGDLWIDTDDANKLYRAAIIGANEIKAGEWESAQDSSYTSKNVTFAQSSIPTSLAIGDIWVDTDDSNKLYRAASAGSDEIKTGEWVLVQDSSYTSKNQTFAQNDIPTSIAEGDLWVDTNDGNKLYRASSAGANEIKAGEWILVRDDDISNALQDAAAALEVADGEIVGWYQASAPAIGGSPAQAHFGDIWIDTDDSPLDSSSIYRCEDIIGGSQGTLDWRAAPSNAIGLIYLNAYTAQTTADGKIKTYYQAGIPTSSDIGDLWVDTDDKNKLYRAAIAGANEIKAGEWEDARDTDISQALQDAATAIEVADGEIVGWYQASAPTIGGSPSQAHFGDIWIDIDDSPLDTSSIYRCEDIVGGSQGTLDWRASPSNAIGLVYLNAYSAQTTADGKIKTYYQAAIPTSSDVGDLWVDTDDSNKLYRAAIAGANEIKAGEWEDARDGGIATAMQDAATALEVADGEIVGWYQASQPTIGGSPAQAHFGDIWIDTDDTPVDSSSIYRCEDVGGGSQGALGWYSASTNAIGLAFLAAYDAQSTADGKIVTFYEDDSPGPTGQVIGDLWVDTTGAANRLHRWSGSQWIDVQDADIAQAIGDAADALEDAAAALEVADGEIIGWYQISAPAIGGSPLQATFGDIWIDTTNAPNLDADDIHRCQDVSGGSQGTLGWYHTTTNAIGLAYLAAYNAQDTADHKIVTFYEDDSPGPTGQVEGDLWVDTTGGINRLHRWDGDEWIDVQDADIAQALEDAGDALTQVGNLQEIIDGEIVGWFQDDEPVVGGSPDYAKYGDIWIDTNFPGGVDEDAIFRCQDPSGGSTGVLDWYNAPNNAIGLAYLAAYNANLVAGDKITTYYQAGIPTSENIGDLWVDTDDSNKLYRAAAAGANEIKAGEWVLIRDQGITDALYDLYDANGLLSYFGITDTTLIDGNKILTSGVLVDYLLSGLSAAGSPQAFNIASGAYETIDVGLSTHIREVRSTASTGIWPALAYKMKYKIQVSVDGSTYSYIRGTAGAYAELLKMTYTDRDSVVHDTPIVYILEGNYVRYIRITFGGYYKQNNDAVSGSLACDFQAYGAMAYIDGGTLLAQTLLLGSFELPVRTTLSQADEVYDAGALTVITNFNGRNDRIAVTPATPTTLNITRELNTDGTSNLNFSWSF